jgi:hypothetical protein
MHTRVRLTSELAPDERNVVYATKQLIGYARDAGVGLINGFRLPDMALLAHLQHHGAATPLLDVTVDPLVALWMVAFASAHDPESLDETSGTLYAIRKPGRERWIQSLDARAYWHESEPSVSADLGGNTWWYDPPDVTERLRVQRGSFLLAPMAMGRAEFTTMPLSMKLGHKDRNWLKERMDKRGEKGRPVAATTDVAAFVVRGSLKSPLRELLIERSGLTLSAVYPTPWNQPFIERFSAGYGRARSVES